LFILILFSAAAISAQDAQSAAAGLVETLAHTYGPFDLQADTLQQIPPVMEVVFPEDMWLVGYHTEMIDRLENRLPRELQCHTFLGTSMPKHHTQEQVVGIFSDGYTEGIELPPGFGIFFKAGEKVIWDPMFNNRNAEQVTASLRLKLDIIRARRLPAGLRPLKTTFRTIRDTSDLYLVAPGTDTRETTFTLPFAGKIHVIGTHIHPYGVSIELTDLTRNQLIWKAVGSKDRNGKLMAMPVYADAEGYSVERGSRFKLAATYENPTTHKIDAMAGVFILYSPAEKSHDQH